LKNNGHKIFEKLTVKINLKNSRWNIFENLTVKFGKLEREMEGFKAGDVTD
jgi:hypothetical protein